MGNNAQDHSPHLSHKSSVISDDEKIMEKHIKNLDTANKNQTLIVQNSPA